MLVFTDASHSPKPRMSGLGAVIILNDKEFKIGSYIKDCRDNNVAEMAAICLACKFIDKNKLQDQCKTITIISDSETALHRITNGTPPQDDFEKYCMDIIDDFLIRNPKVSFMQCKGHVQDGTKLSYYNNIADDIAGDYRRMGLELEKTPNGKKKKKVFKSFYQSWLAEKKLRK